MPTQITKINPLDLNKNISIGLALPFGSCGSDKLFINNFSTKEQIKSNLINLLLTNKGERIMNPEFGADLKLIIFEAIADEEFDIIKDLITTSVNIYIPEITLTNIKVDPNPDYNIVNVGITYQIKISGTADQINIQFT